MKFLRNLGPGFIVTAAFIGPGTVTTASRAGAGFGFALMWAVVFSILATIILQEMAARLGVVGRMGLGEGVRNTFRSPMAKWLAAGFITLAIGFGNAAYQSGNLMGAGLGPEALTGINMSVCILLLGACAFGLLYIGQYKVIEWTLIGLVIVMSLVFLITAICVAGHPGDLAKGFVPKVPANDVELITIIGLIGTTVVPYNLFLHADTVRKKWAERPVGEALTESRWDSGLSIGLGGLVTAAIIVTAAMAFYYPEVAFPAQLKKPEDVKKVADQLAPLLGPLMARITFATGLFAAGLTSTITAPLAAAYALSGVFGWKPDLKSWKFRAVWMVILALGIIAAITMQGSPGQTIFLAQVANGLLLPIIAVFLLIVVNRKDLMGEHRNGWVSNALGILVVLIATGIGVWGILKAFGVDKMIHF